MNGEAELSLRDDPSIPDKEWLYRGVVDDHIKRDGKPRVTSAAFDTRRKTDHVSVDRSSLCTDDETLERLPSSVAVAKLRTGDARAHTPGVASQPLIPENPAHALIIRDPSISNSKWRTVRRKLANACTWAITP